MKQLLIFVGGISTGVVAMTVLERMRNESPPTISSLIHKEPKKHSPWYPIKKETLAFEYGKPLYVTTKTGAKFHLNLYGNVGEPVKFQWTSLTGTSEGSGEVFERLEETSKTKSGIEVRNAGSEVVIDVDGLHLEWSPRDQSSGWIYFDSEALSIGSQLGEQAGAGQPATRPVVEPEGSYKPQPEAEGRDR